MNEDRERVAALYKQIAAAHEELRKIQRTGALGEVEDYVLGTLDGDVKLSELFGDQADLILIHNMGRRCSYCTMWADGFVGLEPHLRDRAALVIATPDAPAVQQDFATGRGWPFRMVSTQHSSLKRDLGFEKEDGEQGPGVSLFHRDEGGTIRHVGSDWFGPGDVYNGAWHLFARLEGGTGEWQPKLSYS